VISEYKPTEESNVNAQPKDIPIVEVSIEVAADRMGGELLKALVDEVRTAPAQWSKLSEVQQEQLIARLRSVVHLETRKAVHLIAKGAREAARVTIESITVKDGAKAVLRVGDSIHELIDYVGQPAVLVMCDPEQFFAAGDDVEADADQPGLPLEGEQSEAEEDEAA
jgi:hypothetical protein